ncbi:Fic family protein [Helicobacter sp. 12S02634-8]|uniref:Fic family protein n=1 Tax=Helicobacter sp. 12S02634-8 TaxID=1476199 RepID=UPI001C0E98B3|nr:Fic family protein [Helicobacter sp. 12S02634-8]
MAIENNTLDIEHITAIIIGKRVLGSPKEIKEVKNAYEAYEQIMGLNGASIEDLLEAHSLMMENLIDDAGRFRNSDVGIFGSEGLVHLAPPSRFVESQIKKLFEWYQQSQWHPLIKSSIFHYEFEFIHPFSDGNGRLGRMWQSKLLGEWNELFYFLPVEELICETQTQYYQALSQSDGLGSSVVFVEYILKLLEHITNQLSLGTLNGTLNHNELAVINLLKLDSKITNQILADKLKLSPRTIQRTLKALILKGYIERVGAKKNGYYKLL